MRRIIDKNRLRQVAPEYTQIFEIVALDRQACIAIKPVLDEFARGIENVEQLFRVHSLRRRKHDHLEAFRYALQKVLQVRPLAHVHLVLNAVEIDGKD